MQQQFTIDSPYTNEPRQIGRFRVKYIWLGYPRHLAWQMYQNHTSNIGLWGCQLKYTWRQKLSTTHIFGELPFKLP